MAIYCKGQAIGAWCFINTGSSYYKFSDRQVWGNSADQDQTAPTLFAIPSALLYDKATLFKFLGDYSKISGCLII